MSELTPITRIESYLDAIVNSGIPPTEDITRIETFLQAIYDNQVCALTPVTRIEMFLGKISGQNIVLPEPITRVELYLAAIAGEDVELPENPITRLEMYLAEWADSGDWTTISGAIVEFITQRAHKLKSCVVSLSPQQDLHGYDSPWPAGGGKNKIDINNPTSSSPTISASNNTIVCASGYQNSNIVYQVSGLSTNTQYYLSLVVRTNTTGWKINMTLTDGGTGEASVNSTGTIGFAFTPTSATVEIKIYQSANGSWTADELQLEVGSSKTSFSPYSNICPISGWTGVSVWRDGKNLFDESLLETYGCVKQSDGSYCAENGNVLVDKVFFRNTKGISGAFRLVYKYKYNSSSSAGVRPVFVYTDGTRTEQYLTPTETETTYTTTTNSNKTLDYMYFSYGSGGVKSWLNIAVAIGSEEMPYEPYNGNSYPATWEDEVYGATPDIVSGEMPVTKNLITIGSLSWDYYGGVFYANVVGKANNNASTNVVCSVYAQGSRNATGAGDAASILQDKQITGFYDPNSANSWVYVKDSSYTTALAFKTAMGEQTICYELATPIHASITPTPITALKGYNVMWSNAGDIEVTVHGTPVEVETLQALNMLLGGAYHNEQTADDVSDEEALDIILGGEQR